MAFEVFKGIEQVTWESFSGLTDDKKIGKLWFVKRTVADGGNDEDAYGEIYFGTRHYGHFSQAEINAINANKKAIEDINTELTTVKDNVESQGKSIDGLQALVDSIAKYEYKTVVESDVPSGVTPTEVDELPSATKDSAEYVKVSGETTTTYYKKEALSFDSLLNAIEAIRNEYKIKSVKADDNVLSVDDSGVLSAKLSLKYNSENKKIYLYGKDGKTAIGEPIDATAFIKDGMLETAEIVDVTKTEDDKFIYGSSNTEAAGVKSEGKYIRLHFNTDSEKTDVFLSVSEMVKAYTAGKDVAIKADDNSINVALGEDITVAGLSDTYGCGLIKNGTKISKGTSLSEILKMMLSKELYPSGSTKPSISITKASVVSGLHEIGESVSVGTASISKNGGKFNNNGWIDPKQPTPLFAWSNEKMSSKITSGADGYVAQTDVNSIAQGTATTVKGTNTVTINASANYSAPTNKPITNLGNSYDGEASTWVDGIATGSTTISWTGVYPCFTNSDNLGNEPTKKVALQTSKTFYFDVMSHNSGGKDFRFAYPDGWEIVSFKVKSLDGKYYEFAADYSKNAGTISKTIQSNSITYHYLKVNNGEASYEIVLNKELNA